MTASLAFAAIFIGSCFGVSIGMIILFAARR